jgi:hypothetical protein
MTENLLQALKGLSSFLKKEDSEFVTKVFEELLGDIEIEDNLKFANFFVAENLGFIKFYENKELKIKLALCLGLKLKNNDKLDESSYAVSFDTYSKYLLDYEEEEPSSELKKTIFKDIEKLSEEQYKEVKSKLDSLLALNEDEEDQKTKLSMFITLGKTIYLSLEEWERRDKEKQEEEEEEDTLEFIEIDMEDPENLEKELTLLLNL